jgi:hypothetical protein
MTWLERVWGQLVAGEPTLVAAVLGVVGSVIAGVLGGWLGGRLSVKAALRGAEKAHKDNLERESRAMGQQVVGFVQALQAEVEGLLVSFEAEIAPTIRAAKAEDGVTVFFPIGRDYFIVYPANASMLGHIDDLQLRKRIVKMYIAMKAMIDTIHMNNRYLDAFNRARNLSIEGDTVAMVAAALDTRFAKAELVQYSEGMKRALGTVMSEIGGFYEASNAWLIGRGMQPNPPPQFIRP